MTTHKDYLEHKKQQSNRNRQLDGWTISNPDKPKRKRVDSEAAKRRLRAISSIDDKEFEKKLGIFGESY